MAHCLRGYSWKPWEPEWKVKSCVVIDILDGLWRSLTVCRRSLTVFDGLWRSLTVFDGLLTVLWKYFDSLLFVFGGPVWPLRLMWVFTSHTSLASIALSCIPAWFQLLHLVAKQFGSSWSLVAFKCMDCVLNRVFIVLGSFGDAFLLWFVDDFVMVWGSLWDGVGCF